MLLGSGALGFRLGSGAFADWQVAVETAQVVAGIVEYPAGNPFYIYHTKLWTVLHQILALLLGAGVTERTLSIYLGGVVGMVSFQAIGLIVYALSHDVLLAVAASGLVFFSRVAEAGAVYPVWMVGTSHTYGIIGLGYATLAAGVFGAGWPRLGLFLLGAAPAVHPSLGIWFGAIAAAALLWDFRRVRDELPRWLPAFAAGVAVTIVSLSLHLLQRPDLPPLDRATSERYLAAFVAFWDMHRQPVNLEGAAVKLNVAALVIAVLWLTRFARDLPAPAAILLRMVAAAAVLGIVLALVSWVPPERLPPALLVLMPARVLNFNVLVFGALVIGIAGAYRRTWWGAALLLLMTLALLFGARSGLFEFQGDHAALARRFPAFLRVNSTTNVVFAAELLVLAALLLAGRARSARSRIALVLHAGALTVAFLAAGLAWRIPPPRGFALVDRTNDSLLRLLAEGDGVLLTGGDLHLIQLRTRRPVLIDGGGLDALPYALEGAIATERILREVYSVELLDPPEEARFRGALPQEFVRQAWEGYPPERWQRIGAAFGVRQVLTPAHWELQLPVFARNAAFTVYDIRHIAP